MVIFVPIVPGSDLEEQFYSPRSRPASGASSERAPLKSNLGQKPPVTGMQTASTRDRDQKTPEVSSVSLVMT